MRVASLAGDKPSGDDPSYLLAAGPLHYIDVAHREHARVKTAVVPPPRPWTCAGCSQPAERLRLAGSKDAELDQPLYELKVVVRRFPRHELSSDTRPATHGSDDMECLRRN
jgi:hypothetical protein